MKTKTRKRPIKDDALGLNDGDGPGSYATDLIFAFEKQLARRGTVDAEDEDEVGHEDEAADGHTVGATPHRGPSIGGSSKERAHTEGTKLISDSAASRGSFTTLNTQQELIALLKARWDTSARDEYRAERKRQSLEAHELKMDRKRFKREREALLLEEQRLKVELLKRQLGGK